MDVKVRCSEELINQPWSYYHEILIMKQELLTKGCREPFRVRSNLDISHNAEKGEHLFTTYNPFTEKVVILKQDYILEWIIDRELEVDILVLETVSKEDFLKCCEVEVKRKNEKIKTLLKEIEDLMDYRVIKYGVFDDV